ncbi:hypothetical protein D3C74_402790 [compost metagenome]
MLQSTVRQLLQREIITLTDAVQKLFSFVLYNNPIQIDWLRWIELRTEMLDVMHKMSHNDELRYQLLMRYLRQVDRNKKQRGFLKKFKRQWNMYKTNIEAEPWHKQAHPPLNKRATTASEPPFATNVIKLYE